MERLVSFVLCCRSTRDCQVCRGEAKVGANSSVYRRIRSEGVPGLHHRTVFANIPARFNPHKKSSREQFSEAFLFPAGLWKPEHLPTIRSRRSRSGHRVRLKNAFGFVGSDVYHRFSAAAQFAFSGFQNGDNGSTVFTFVDSAFFHDGPLLS